MNTWRSVFLLLGDESANFGKEFVHFANSTHWSCVKIGGRTAIILGNTVNQEKKEKGSDSQGRLEFNQTI